MPVWAILLTILIGLPITVLLAWRAQSNFKTFRAGLGKPILKDATLPKLALMPKEWPLRQKRWPSPRTEGGPDMEPELAGAYARLAIQRRDNSSLAAEILAVIGGSWLGVTIPVIWSDYRERSAQITEGLNSGQYSPVGMAPWVDFPPLAPLLLIAIAAAMRLLERTYEEAAAMYGQVASPPETPVVATPTSAPQPPIQTSTGIRGFLRRLVR